MSGGLDDVRPLLAGSVRWDEHGASIDVGHHVIRIDAVPALLRPILADCDGRTPVAQLGQRHGDEGRELLVSLLSEGALVDGEQAWRVLHRQSSVGTALGRAISEDELRQLQLTTFAPEHDAGPEVELDPAASDVLALAGQRSSTTPASARVPATFASLSAVLAAAYGVAPASGTSRSGTVASAGALYPLVVHVVLREPLAPAGAGLWWHDPQTLRLRLVAELDGDLDALFVAEPSCAALVARRQPIVFLSADLRRPSRKYGPRGYRYALVEAGAAMHAAQLTAVELGVGLRPIGGIDDAAVSRFLMLPDGAVPLLALLVGS